MRETILELNLHKKVAMVTGGSKGIGKDISLALASEGVRVVVLARGSNAINELTYQIKDAGGEAFGIQVDATSELDSKKAVQETLKKYGQLDFLVNNAGGAIKFGSFQECKENDWLDSFKLNVMSCVNFTRAAESALLKSKQGRILTISSLTGLQPGIFNPHYSITKAATINLSKHLSNIYASKGICCNVICAGPVHSDSWDKNVASLAFEKKVTFEEAFSQLEIQEKLKIPLGKVGEPEDIAAMAIFLLSEKAKWITGACFQVSGGKYAGIS